MDFRIPEKQYFRIGEVARIAGVETYVLRFWEGEFPALKPKKTQSNHRLYTRRDVALVLRIRDLLYDDGYTIAGARRQLRIARGETSEIPARTRALLDQIRNDVEELLRLVEE